MCCHVVDCLSSTPSVFPARSTVVHPPKRPERGGYSAHTCSGPVSNHPLQVRRGSFGGRNSFGQEKVTASNYIHWRFDGTFVDWGRCLLGGALGRCALRFSPTLSSMKPMA